MLTSYPFSRTCFSRQARLTEDLTRLTEYSQERQWLRDDIPAKALAVLFQILVFGRSLDDVSNNPVDESEWEESVGALFGELLKR